MRLAQDIPAALVNLRLNVAESFGADKGKMIAKSGIDPDLLSHPANRIPVEDTLNVWQIILDETGRHDIGLQSGKLMKMTSMGMLGYVMMNSNSIGLAFEKLRTHQRLVASVANLNIRLENEYTFIEAEIVPEWDPRLRYTIDFMVASIYGIIKSGTANSILPLEAGFQIEKPNNSEVYIEVFETKKVVFNSKNFYLKYKSSDLSNPIIGANSDLFDHFSALLEETVLEHEGVEQYSRKAKKFITKGLKAEIPKIEEVANEMAMSIRSLQNALKEEGHSYQELLESVRKEVSVKQLKNQTFNISDVAFLTGFSDLAVFSRNFKKWTGMTPSEYRLQFS